MTLKPGREMERAVLSLMRERETTDTITMPFLALNLPVDEDQLHGRQHHISRAIERLRREGYLKDVEDRCPTCRRAKRSRTVVSLFLTDKGRTELP